MFLAGFRVRSAERDLANDGERFSRLRQTVSALVTELRNERSGLERRFGEISASAAFAQASLENEGDLRFASTIDELTVSMERYARRIRSLQDQIDFAEELGKRVDGFSATPGEL